jgi:predicted acyl esterase
MKNARNHLHDEGRVAHPPFTFTAIDPFDAASLINKGHRLRPDTSSGKLARYDVNPTAGEPFGSNRMSRTVKDSVLHRAQEPSWLTVRVVN